MKNKDEQKDPKAITLKTLTKGKAWEMQENDIFRLWKAAEKDADIKESRNHYHDIIRAAFELEEVKVDKPEIIKKYEDRGFKIGLLKTFDNDEQKWALKKRAILRVTDLTYENIRHITATHLLEVIDRNFGGGWDSLSQSIKDIIESGFDISTTTLPKDRLHNPGGMYEKKVEDSFEVLEIEKGSWVEAIFAKAKPVVEKPTFKEASMEREFNDDDDDDIDLPEDDNRYEDDDEDEGDIDELLEQESYRTEFDTDDADLTLDDVESAEDDY